MSLAVGGMTTGISSQVVGEVGGTSAPDIQAGLGKVAKGYKYAGSLMGAGMVLDSLESFGKGFKKKKR